MDGDQIVPDDRNRTGMGTMGIMVALVLAAIVGLGLWSLAGNNTTASNNAPGVTTGSSTTPSPSNPPAGVKGQGESNSTR
jgi:hypothetical protein